MFSRKSGLVPGFTTILKCTPECDGIVALHIDGKAETDEMRLPTLRETLHPQHLQAQEFRRQWGHFGSVYFTVIDQMNSLLYFLSLIDPSRSKDPFCYIPILYRTPLSTCVSSWKV